MSPIDRERVESLCLKALSKTAPDRVAFLDASCGADAALRREVESILAARSEAGEFLEAPPWAAGAARLPSGTRVGPYEIETLIGAGGMGEVYKARDTRLDRAVAIKVLPAAVTADPERRARFQREAKTIASLNHPHICTLHDVGDHDGSMFLVMELLEGESLAACLSKGPLPLTRALEVSAQIADALSTAHRQGIVHRDLKPGNVMLTKSGAKLLDFGLAKLKRHGEQPAATHLASSPTLSGLVTSEGMIVGTLPYMAPEQLEGRSADARTDLWALGAILYEMVAGRRAFTGESSVSLMGAILERDPEPLATFQPLTPPALARVVTRCLAKDPDARWDSAHDIADELRWMHEASGSGSVTGAAQQFRRGRLAAFVGTAAIVGAAIGAGAIWRLRSPAPRPSVSRVSLEVLPAETLDAGGYQSLYLPTPGGSLTALAWTPDGQALVFVGRRGGAQQLYVRRLDAAEARPLTGTEGAQVPAVSPDGRDIAFWAQGAIKHVPLSGGPVTNLVSGVALAPKGLAWDARGRVFFGRNGRIWHVPPGGTQAVVTTRRESEQSHSLPCVLPGDHTILYTVRKRETTWGDEEVVAQNLSTGTRTLLLTDAADARYVATGHLVFLRRGQLMAVAFDPRLLETNGREVALLDAVAQALVAGNASDITGAGQFAISATGTLAWLPGAVPPERPSALITVDRRGQVSRLSAPERNYGPTVRLSPDGRRLVVVVRTLTEGGLWIYDLPRENLTPVVRGGEASWPIWAPDGQRLAFLWRKNGRSSIASQLADGSTLPQILAVGSLAPSSWSPDGRTIAATQSGSTDVMIATLRSAKATVQPLFETRDTEVWPEISPDGRWLAFGSDVAARFEVWLRPFPGPGAAVQVSLDGGQSPAWHQNGRELFFLGPRDSAGRQRMMVVELGAGASPRIGRPRVLFEFDSRELPLSCIPTRCFDVAPDGQRFYAVMRQAPPSPPRVTRIQLIQNWFEELKAKVPSRR